MIKHYYDIHHKIYIIMNLIMSTNVFNQLNPSLIDYY